MAGTCRRQPIDNSSRLANIVGAYQQRFARHVESRQGLTSILRSLASENPRRRAAESGPRVKACDHGQASQRCPLHARTCTFGHALVAVTLTSPRSPSTDSVEVCSPFFATDAHLRRGRGTCATPPTGSRARRCTSRILAWLAHMRARNPGGGAAEPAMASVTRWPADGSERWRAHDSSSRECWLQDSLVKRRQSRAAIAQSVTSLRLVQEMC